MSRKAEALSTNLHDVNPANTVKLADFVQGDEELQAIRKLLTVGADLDRNTLFKLDGNVLRSGRCGHGIIGAVAYQVSKWYYL